MAYHIDPAHSQIQFSVRHMMISTVRGTFEEFGGTVDLDTEQPENTTVDVRIDAASIDTREDDRDNHLRSPDFLNVEEYPYIRFKSKRVELLDDERARLIGDLTIRDVTQEVILDVKYNGKAKSPWGTTSYGFEAHTVVDRKDWGLEWNQVLETGGVLVGDEIELELFEGPGEVESLEKVDS